MTDQANVKAPSTPDAPGWWWVRTGGPTAVDGWRPVRVSKSATGFVFYHRGGLVNCDNYAWGGRVTRAVTPGCDTNCYIGIDPDCTRLDSDILEHDGRIVATVQLKPGCVVRYTGPDGPAEVPLGRVPAELSLGARAIAEVNRLGRMFDDITGQVHRHLQRVALAIGIDAPPTRESVGQTVALASSIASALTQPPPIDDVARERTPPEAKRAYMLELPNDTRRFRLVLNEGGVTSLERDAGPDAMGAPSWIHHHPEKPDRLGVPEHSTYQWIRAVAEAFERTSAEESS